MFEEHDEDVQDAEEAEVAPQREDKDSELRPTHHSKASHGIAEEDDEDDDEEVSRFAALVSSQMTVTAAALFGSQMTVRVAALFSSQITAASCCIAPTIIDMLDLLQGH